MLLKCLHIIFLSLAVFIAQAQDNEKGSIQEGNRKLYGFNQFRKKLPFAVADSVVTFFLRGNKNAKRVILSGSFSNWSPDALLMTKTDSGWIAFVKLIAGKHLYKFIIDGSWNVDEDNLLSEGDELGNINSVYYKTNCVFILPGFSITKKVWLSASFNNWRTTELPLTKTASGWEIPLYLSDGSYSYKFKTDNEWHNDSKNSNPLRGKLGSSNPVITIDNDLGSIKDLAYYQNELAIDGHPSNKFQMAVNTADLGDAYMSSGFFENARKSFEIALGLYEQLKNTDSIASLSFKIALAYKSLSDFPHLLEYLQKTISANEKSGNEFGLAKAYREMGYYYLNLPYLPKASQFFLRSLALYDRLNSQPEKARVLGDLGHTYLLLGDGNNGFLYLQKALVLNQQIGNKSGTANNMWLLGGYYLSNLSNVSLALDSYKKAQELFEETGDKVKVAYVLFALADLYRETPDSALATAGINASQKYIRSIEFRKKGFGIIKPLLPESEQLWPLYELVKTFERIGRYDSAYHYYKEYISLRDKIVGVEKQKGIVRLEEKYEFDKKEDSLKLQQAITDEKLQKQVLLFNQQKQQLALNQSQLALSNKEKDLQHLVYLKTQADLQNEKLVKQQKEKENQLQSAQVKTLTQDKAIYKLNQQRQWVFIIGGFTLLALGSLYFLYRSRIRGVKLETQLIKEKAEQEKKETAFQQKLADVSMSALRSQMNPHFIFNCLNSIKLYTTQNDSAAASEYLGKFSKLIRLILENSRNERITLSSELAALKLYIEMEAMRFKEKLSFSLSVEKNVEEDYIEIPPLLLQPYVENAIWHGLMPREEGGHISITVAMQEEESLLEINITDNGIGRAAAAAMNNKAANKHRSYGMKATKERIALINQIYKTGASVCVHDLINSKGHAAGTEVILQIPV